MRGVHAGAAPDRRALGNGGPPRIGVAKRTEICLTAVEVALLERYVDQEGCSQAEAIRAGVRELVHRLDDGP